MKTISKHAALLLIAGASLVSAHPAKDPHFKDCNEAGKWVTKQYESDSSNVTDIVTRAVLASPDCSCEIVKSAITASEASAQEVAAIVEAVATAVPAQMVPAAKCAVAVAPDSASAVNAALAKIDPSFASNPLDLPGVSDGADGEISPGQESAVKPARIIRPRIPAPATRNDIPN